MVGRIRSAAGQLAGVFPNPMVSMDTRRTISAYALGLALVFGPALAWGQNSTGQTQDHHTAGQDMRNAGHDTKNAAKDTGHAVKNGSKKAWNKTKGGTKNAWHKTKNTTKGAYHCCPAIS